MDEQTPEWTSFTLVNFPSYKIETSPAQPKLSGTCSFTYPWYELQRLSCVDNLENLKSLLNAPSNP